MERKHLTSGIKPPKFRVGQFVLNEYELREMIARVSEGSLSPCGITIKDKRGIVATIGKTGLLSKDLHGFDMMVELKLRRVKTLGKK